MIDYCAASGEEAMLHHHDFKSKTRRCRNCGQVLNIEPFIGENLTLTYAGTAILPTHRDHGQ